MLECSFNEKVVTLGGFFCDKLLLLSPFFSEFLESSSNKIIQPVIQSGRDVWPNPLLSAQANVR